MTKTLRESLTYPPVELAFGTSGLRGLVTNMTDLECYINTRGFLKFLLDSKDIQTGTAIGLSGDLRDSTPRILSSVAQGITDANCKIVNLGKIPTPAAAYFGARHKISVAMVTGSHIPDDRNGIKFYKSRGEVLKTDEDAIKAAIAEIRKSLYNQDLATSIFNQDGSLKDRPDLPESSNEAAGDFLRRYSSVFSDRPLTGKKIVVYQHSSLAAEMLVELLQALGADVIPVDKSESFVAIDTENVTPENQQYFRDLAQKYPGSFAIVSADGDADRPFVIDESGIFHRGDIVGTITAEFLKVEVAVVPISASDAVGLYLNKLGIELIHTKIGSPYVIAEMEQAVQRGLSPVVGWEVNGGFLTATEIQVNGQVLSALPTRDSFLPIVCTLMAAVDKKSSLSALFKTLPQRFTQAGLIDNFPTETSQAILAKYAQDNTKNRSELEKVFTPKGGFDRIISINSLDGIRMTFKNGDIAHIRPSGNAPQLRIYSVANKQQRADQIVSLAIAEPNGTLRRLEKSL
jgi:phosphomannomutase